jgi:hypothetical protein
VRTQVAARDIELGLGGVDRGLCAQPAIRPGEAHLLPVAGGEDQHAADRGGLQHRPPRLGQLLGQVGRLGLPRDGRAQFLAGQRIAVERLRHGVDQAFELVGLDPGRLRPGRLGEADVVGAERGLPERVLVGGQQVQRPAHRPRLDERPVLPQRGGDVAGVEPVDARVQRQLGRRHDLRVHAAQLAGHVEHRRDHRALVQPVAAGTPRGDVAPGQLGIHGA